MTFILPQMSEIAIYIIFFYYWLEISQWNKVTKLCPVVLLIDFIFEVYKKVYLN